MRSMKTSIAALSTLLFATSALAQEPNATALAVEKDLIQLIERISPTFVAIGGGSGVVISEDGYMLTNHHVAGERAIGAKWPVHLAGGRAYMAVMIGTDPWGDISLLKIETQDKMPFCPLGDSDAAQIGDVAVALGNPYLFSRDATPTVTLGIISALHRNQGGYSDCIQTDAPINPGNSGGPLLNTRGEVIGINGRIAVRFGNRVNTGVGYAIPANQIKAFMEDFRKGGTVAHGRLEGLDAEDFREGRAAKVTKVAGEAARAGFQAGDLILAVDGRDVYSATRLNGILGTIPAGAEVPVIVQRGSERLTLKARLALRADALPAGSPDDPFLGVRLSEQRPEGMDGLIVDEVVSGSAAEDAGVQSGDILVEIEGRSLKSVADLVNALRAKKVGDVISIKLVRDGVEMTLSATLKRRG